MAEAGDLDALAEKGLAIMKRELDRVAAAPGPLEPDEVTMVEKFTRVALTALRLQPEDDWSGYTPEELDRISKGEQVPRKARKR